MKSLIFLIVSILLIQSTFADGGVTSKKCEDFIPQQTCDNLRKVAQLLHEKVTIVQDAVREAIAHHKTKAADMLAYIKGYIAERFPCERVLTPAICTKIFELGKAVKLTTQEVRLAIENAVANGADTINDIYKKAVDIMKDAISCENIISKVACDNLKDVIKKFHEQTSLIKEAIMTAAQKHITKTVDVIKFIKDTLVEKAVNFKCEDVLPADRCASIRELASNLHLTVTQVRTAIKDAVVNGATSAIDLYNRSLDFLTNNINCAAILGQTACDNLVQAAKKLKEQTKLIQEAIMAAAKKHITTVTGILKLVKDTLVEKAVNFKCTDVLPDFQCNQIKNVAQHFKIKASELRRVLAEAVVNGTVSVKQIYDLTIGGLIEDAKNLKCEDLIPKATCDRLDKWAEKLNLKVSEVTTAVKVAIATGKDLVHGLVKFVREYLAEKLSCENVLSKPRCDRLARLASFFGINFKLVVEKLRSLVANGVTSVLELYAKILSYVKDLWSSKLVKRDVADAGREVIINRIMKLVEHAISVGKDVRQHIRETLKKLLETGRFRIGTFLKELIEKYTPNDEYTPNDQEVTVFRRSVVDDLKAKLKSVHENVSAFIKNLLAKIKAELAKIKEQIKGVVSSDDLDVTSDVMEDMADLALKEEVKNAEQQIENMVYNEL